LEYAFLFDSYRLLIILGPVTAVVWQRRVEFVDPSPELQPNLPSDGVNYGAASAGHNKGTDYLISSAEMQLSQPQEV
jgi:hypothetical protein